MRGFAIALIPIVSYLCTGCQTHMIFLEESHAGLHVEFTADGSQPADVDIGIHRGIVAVLPQRLDTDTNGKEVRGSIVSDEEGNLTIKPDAGELTSIYSTFEANVALFDPFEVKHFLATGVAATNIMADLDALKSLGEVK